jgi:hypothetical protein
MKASDILNAGYYFNRAREVKWMIAEIKNKKDVRLTLSNQISVTLSEDILTSCLKEELKICNHNLKIMGVTDIT